MKSEEFANAHQSRPKFTYGDRIRRKAGGPVETVHDLNDTAYYFESGGFCLRDDEDCYRLEEAATGFFRVADTIDGINLEDHSMHGFETVTDFRNALQQLIECWGGRTGMHVGSRHQFLRLKFNDLYDRVVEEVWLPLYLLKAAPVPERFLQPPPDPFIEELDRVMWGDG